MKSLLLTLCLLLTLTSCGIQEDNGDKFLVDLEGQVFRQTRFRSTGGAWRFHNGIRNHLVKDGKIVSSFNLYQEYPTIYCFGEYSGEFISLTREEFLRRISVQGNEESGNYDVHDPWGPGQSNIDNDVDPDAVATIREYYFILSVTKNTVTTGCSFFVEPELFIYLRLYQNGDLLMRDYNREMEFLFRP